MEEKFANPYLKVFSARVRTPSRPEGCDWTVVHRKGAVVIVPVTVEGHFVMIRQERVPIRQSLWEFPAGQIDEDYEQGIAAIHDSAVRELREETGYELGAGGEFVSLGHYFPSPGFTDEHSHLLLAHPVVLSKAGSAPDENEAILECRAFEREDLKAMIANNEVLDANSLSACARMSAMGLF